MMLIGKIKYAVSSNQENDIVCNVNRQLGGKLYQASMTIPYYFVIMSEQLNNCETNGVLVKADIKVRARKPTIIPCLQKKA